VRQTSPTGLAQRGHPSSEKARVSGIAIRLFNRAELAPAWSLSELIVPGATGSWCGILQADHGSRWLQLKEMTVLGWPLPLASHDGITQEAAQAVSPWHWLR